MTINTIENSIQISVHDRRGMADRLPAIVAYLQRRAQVPLSYHPGWLNVLADGLGHVPFLLEAVRAGEVGGYLCLCHVRSPIFGRFLVSLPYLNYGGAVADDDTVAAHLVDRAMGLADELDVKYLELRQELRVAHPGLGHELAEKVNMRLRLPATVPELWDGASSKVRNQIRKGQNSGLDVTWGGMELLDAFHQVFSRNMRDLGTPTFGRAIFREVLRQFPGRAEFCVVREGPLPVAAALLLHGTGVTEVPSASSLRSHNKKNANMLMYYNLLERSISRGQATFDFGRSSPDSNTYRFKAQWGAMPGAAVWQYYLRRGGLKDARPDNPRYRRLIRIWQRLPVTLTRLAGPLIVRGIP